MITEATVTCPACGARSAETMPPGYSQTEFMCAKCGVKSSAAGKECCIFCKYSDQFCPPKQNLRHGCAG